MQLHDDSGRNLGSNPLKQREFHVSILQCEIGKFPIDLAPTAHPAIFIAAAGQLNIDIGKAGHAIPGILHLHLSSLYVR